MKNNSSDRLKEYLSPFREGVGVAFSGGADSTYLLHAAMRATKGRAVALLAVSPFLSGRERDWAVLVAEHLRSGLKKIQWESLSYPAVRENSRDRCYFCKKAMYTRLLEVCKDMGLEVLVDGTQTDDLLAERPGLAAISELGVMTPLVDCSVGKKEIRKLSRELGLPTWNRASQSCLATRISSGIPITEDLLTRIEAGENFLQDRGIWPTRIRVDETSARVYVAPQQTEIIDKKWSLVEAGLRGIGFSKIEFAGSLYRETAHNAALGAIRG